MLLQEWEKGDGQINQETSLSMGNGKKASSAEQDLCDREVTKQVSLSSENPHPVSYEANSSILIN